MVIDFKNTSEKQIYIMYSLYRVMEEELESIQNRNEEETKRLGMVRHNIEQIEAYSAQKRSEGIRWSLTGLFREAGMNRILTLEFYPGTESYNLYGQKLLVKVEYSDDDLRRILQSMHNGYPEVTGRLKFKKIPGFTDGELDSRDIFGIQFR